MRHAPDSFGQYRVHEEIGVGGMARVHRAEQVQRDGSRRAIALKRMLPHFVDNEEAVEAFLREGRLATLMRHRNIAKTYELGKVGDDYFIAMELITGRNLSELAMKAASTVPLPIGVTLDLVSQLCDALEYAHNLCDDSGKPLGLIHRDISPSNVIVTDDGIVKLIDFGIAKAAAEGLQTRGITLKGKFGYMAPEYLAGKIDARADVFAVGVVAYELLTNRFLFTADSDIETMNRLREMTIAPPSKLNPQVPSAIDALVLTALERDPDQRWQHARALRDALAPTTQRFGIAAAGVAEWIAQTFGETLAFDSATIHPGSALPLGLLDLAAEPEAIVPSARPVEASPDWTDNTNVRNILAPIETRTTGSLPVILGEPEPAPVEVRFVARPPVIAAPVDVIAPRRTTQLVVLLLLLAIVIAAAVVYFVVV